MEALSSSITAERWQALNTPDTGINIITYSDLHDGQGIWHPSLKTTYEFPYMTTESINHRGGGIGRPITSTLMPIQLFAMFFPMVQVLSPSMSPLPYAYYFQDFIPLHDELSVSLGILSNYRSILVKYKFYTSSDELRFVDECLAPGASKDTSFGIRSCSP